MSEDQSPEPGPAERSSAEQPTGATQSSEQHSNEQCDQRLSNLQALIARGIEPYPYSYEASHTAAELHEEHGGLAAGEVVEGSRVSVAGRLMLLRPIS